MPPKRRPEAAADHGCFTRIYTAYLELCRHIRERLNQLDRRYELEHGGA